MKNKIPRSRPSPPTQQTEASYGQFEASSLFCTRCRRAVPVRKRLLLVLPDGDKFEYLCTYCSNSLGTKMEYEQRDVKLLVAP